MSYHSKSFRQKSKKLFYDLNGIYSNTLFKNNTLKITEFDSKSCVSMEELYKKLVSKTENDRAGVSKPFWIKDNKLTLLENLKEDMVRIFTYHYNTNKYFLESLIREILFFDLLK